MEGKGFESFEKKIDAAFKFDISDNFEAVLTLLMAMPLRDW